MKQLLILSGKGGTGKTTVASAFIKLLNAKAYADCDVDAPNLHLVNSQNEVPEISDYFGMNKAEIDNNLCVKCNKCVDNCRFDAIKSLDKYEVDNFACEGCGVCEYVCSTNAIKLIPSKAGDIMLYSNDNRIFSTAQLKMGSGNSGMLVTNVKKQLKNADCDIAVIDGSPGIGCPVIASISGAYMVLIVAEPSISGISDMERIIKTASRFGTKISVCVNKFDTNLENTKKIKMFCKDNSIDFVGEIPFDKNAVKAINNGHTIVEIECEAKKSVEQVFENTMAILNRE